MSPRTSAFCPPQALIDAVRARRVAEERAERAARRVVTAVRRWFKHTGEKPPADVRARIEWEQRAHSLHGHVIVAAGLDMEARADLATARRKARKAWGARGSGGRAAPANRRSRNRPHRR